GARVQPLQERPGGLGELRVHHDDAVAVHQVPDRAAAHGEVPDVAADRREHGLLAGAQQHAGEAGAGEGRGDEPGEGGGQEVTTGRRHDGLLATLNNGPCSLSPLNPERSHGTFRLLSPARLPRNRSATMQLGFHASGGRARRRHPSFRAFPLIAATTILAGCAASGEADVIRLGLAGPLNEPPGKGMHQGALLAVEEVNARGGVRGRRLDLVVRDDAMNPARAIEVAEEFRDRTDVVAVVGHLSSGASIAASDVYSEPGKGLVAISPGATSPEMSTTGAWTFRVCPSDLQQTAALAECACRALGLRRAVIVDVNDSYGRGVRDAFTPVFERLGGTVLSADPYLPDFLEDERALDPYLERGIRNGMDALVIVGMGGEVTDILRASRRLGFQGTVMGTDGLMGIAEAGAVAEGVVISSGFLVDRPTAT